MSIQALRDRLARLDKMERTEPEWSTNVNRGEVEAALSEYDALRAALEHALPIVEAHCEMYGDDGPLGKLRAVLRQSARRQGEGGGE